MILPNSGKPEFGGASRNDGASINRAPSNRLRHPAGDAFWIRDTFSAMIRSMKTQTIEIDDDTAMALKQRAQERGLTVPELVAELVTLEAGSVDADAADIAELDRRWNAFEAQGSVAASDDVVRWLQTWGTTTFRSARRTVKSAAPSSGRYG